MILLGRKTVITSIDTNNIDPVELDAIPIPMSQSIEDLEVLVDQSFGEDSWVKQVWKKTLFLLNGFYRCDGTYLPLPARHMLVNAMILPIIDS